MKRFLAWFCTILILFAVTPAAYAVGDVPQAVLNARKSVFRVMAEDNKNSYSGSCFVIATDDTATYFATCYHVLENTDIEKFKIVLHDTSRVEAELVAFDKDYDTCIIKTREPIEGAIPLALADEERLITGSAVYALGFPAVGDYFMNDYAYHYDDMTVTDGIVTALRRGMLNENKRALVLQMNVAINPGNSGGPLLNSEACVVGLNAFGYLEASSMFGSISVMHLIEMMEMHEIPVQMAPRQAPENKPMIVADLQENTHSLALPAFTWIEPVGLPGWVVFAKVMVIVFLAACLGVVVLAWKRHAKSKAAVSVALSGMDEPSFSEMGKDAGGQESAMAQKRKARGELVIWKGVLCLGLCALLLWCGFGFYAWTQYSKAQDALARGDCAAAIKAAYNVWPAYKDNAALRVYIRAMAAFQNKSYAQAQGAFLSLPGFREADAMALESKYKLALAFWEGKELWRAERLFSELGEYKDSVERMERCVLQSAINDATAYYQTGALDAAQRALAGFERLPERAEAQEQRENISAELYQRAQESVDHIRPLLRAYHLHYREKIARHAQEAQNVLAIIPAYRDSATLGLVLEPLKDVSDMETSFQALYAQWDTGALVQEMLFSNYYLGRYLEGVWKGEGKFFSFFTDTKEIANDFWEGFPYYADADFGRPLLEGGMDQNADGVRSDIPSTEGAYFYIENRRLLTGTRTGGNWLMFNVCYEFTFPGKDQLIIIDKDSNRYTLERVK